MLAGGAHSMIHPFGVTGFNLLTALSTHNEAPAKASRPFDLNRDGFPAPRRSAGMLIPGRTGTRQPRAVIHAELTGYGSTADAFRVTDSHPDGRGAITCIGDALKDARINPGRRLHQCPRHQHPGQRPCGIARDQASLPWRRRLQNAGEQRQRVCSGHLIAAAGRCRINYLRRGHAPERLAANHQLRHARSGMRPRLHPQ